MEVARVEIQIASRVVIPLTERPQELLNFEL